MKYKSVLLRLEDMLEDEKNKNPDAVYLVMQVLDLSFKEYSSGRRMKIDKKLEEWIDAQVKGDEKNVH